MLFNIKVYEPRIGDNEAYEVDFRDKTLVTVLAKSRGGSDLKYSKIVRSPIFSKKKMYKS